MGGWDLRADSTVGILQAGDVEVRIHPKVGVGRLLFLLGYASDPRGWRQDEALWEKAQDLVEGVGYAFVTLAERALRRGVLQGYVVREETLPGLKGRLREADQLRRRFGMVVPVEVRYDDYSTDIPENRLLAGAARLLLRLRSLRPLRGRLVHLLGVLGDVTAARAGEPLPAVLHTRLNARYRAALCLARLILTGGSIRFDVGGVGATALQFDMNRVFEDFLTTTLGGALRSRGGKVVPQHSSALDTAGRIRLLPDLTWWHGGTCAAVIDAKYKSLQLRRLPNPDVYQMLAYCTAHGLRRGHLVYAAGNEQVARHVLQGSGVTLEVHALDLDQQPPALLGDVELLAERITSTSDAGALSSPA